MARLDQERQERLEPKRMESCLEALRGYRNLIPKAVSHNEINIYNDETGNIIKFWPYSGWHTGKDIEDGRGFDHLKRELRKLTEVYVPQIDIPPAIQPRPPLRHSTFKQRGIINKLKAIWRWTFHYKVTFVTLESNYTVEHRIGRPPIMTSNKNPKGLRGAKMEVIIVDEYSPNFSWDEVEPPKQYNHKEQ